MTLMRRALLLVSSLITTIVAILVPGCAQNQDAIQIGTTKAGLFLLPMEYRALHPRLEETLGKQVRFVSQPNGNAIGIQLTQGAAHYGLLSCKEYLEIEDPKGIQLLATAINPVGKPARRAFLVARNGTNINTVAECKGRRVAFGTHKDLLTDIAVQKVFQSAGLSLKDLDPEVLTPPPLAFEQRLYLKDDAYKTIQADLTVPVGVIDEVQFAGMKETGGNLITGPSRDQYKILAETRAIPEMLVVAGPNADPAMTEKLTHFLLEEVKGDAMICSQLGVRGFTTADPAAYESVRQWLAAGS